MTKILTLDSSGYVSDPPLIVDRIMRNFFVANYTQTNVHYGQIKSLTHLISRHAENMFELSDAIKRALESMLGAHFESVIVDVEINEIDNANVLQNIKITASVYSGDIAFDVGKLLSLVRNKISNIEDL